MKCRERMNTFPILHSLTVVCLLLFLLTSTLTAHAADRVTLTIGGGILGEEHRLQLEAITGFSLETIDDFFSSDEILINQLLSGGSVPDVYCLDSAFTSMAYVIDKQYACPIENKEIIMAVSQMYPSIQEAVAKDGQIYAVPIRINNNNDCIGIDPVACERADVLPPEPPQSYLAFLDSILAWDEDLADMNLLPFDMSREELIAFSIRQYCNSLHAQRQDLSFQTDAFVTLMDKTLEAASSLEAYPQTESTNYAYCLGLPSVYIGKANGYQPLPLPLTNDGQLMQSVYLEYLFINPNSPHQQEAEQYLAAYCQTVDPIDRMMISPADNHPVVNPNFTEAMRRYGQLITDAEQHLATETDVETRAALKDTIATYRYQLEHPVYDPYWITEESIALYQRLMYASYVPPVKLLDSESVRQCVALYANGGMSTQAFAQKMDRIVQMMQAEAMDF